MQLDDLRDNDEMDMSDDERDGPRSAKRGKFDNRSLLVRKQSIIVFLKSINMCISFKGGERQPKVGTGIVPK